MYRDRTNLFLSYHRTFPHQRQWRSQQGASALDGSVDVEAVGGVGAAEEAHPMLEMAQKQAAQLPPGFFEVVQQIDAELARNDAHMVALAKLYRKNALPGFVDKTADEREIETLSFKTIAGFQRCYEAIKRLQAGRETQRFQGRALGRGELAILENCCRAYAAKIQAASHRFRVMQNNYLKFLNNDDFKPLPAANNDQETLQLLEEEGEREAQQELDSYSQQTLQKQRQKQGETQYLEERDAEITQLAKGVLEVSTIFREMQALILDQGTVVDRIDYNLENTNIDLKQAQRELDRAVGYQKRTQKCKVIMLLSLLVVFFFFVVLLKPRSSGTTDKGPVTRPEDRPPGDSK
ncbi:AaceriAEL026Cp [[Ashbya] aceris (nom. inval.)]|nr:AaceriAEL026Cp [[Ashbya] aceris (nom. inval.)]